MVAVNQKANVTELSTGDNLQAVSFMVPELPYLTVKSVVFTNNTFYVALENPSNYTYGTFVQVTLFPAGKAPTPAIILAANHQAGQTLNSTLIAPLTPGLCGILTFGPASPAPASDSWAVVRIMNPPRYQSDMQKDDVAIDQISSITLATGSSFVVDANGCPIWTAKKSSAGTSASTKTILIVCLVLGFALIVGVIVVAVIFIRRRKARTLRDDEIALVDYKRMG